MHTRVSYTVHTRTQGTGEAAESTADELMMRRGAVRRTWKHWAYCRDGTQAALATLRSSKRTVVTPHLAARKHPPAEHRDTVLQDVEHAAAREAFAH